MIYCEECSSYTCGCPEAKEIKSLRQQLETERVRLAACGGVAMANTPESAAKAREMLPQYRSASCDDVAAAVDREMALRQQLTDSQKREVMLRDALHAIAIEIATENLSAITVLKKCFRMADEALAATEPKP